MSRQLNQILNILGIACLPCVSCVQATDAVVGPSTRDASASIHVDGGALFEEAATLDVSPAQEKDALADAPEASDSESASFDVAIFWANYLANAVYRAQADGSQVRMLVTGQGISNPDGIAVDVGERKMYWTNMDELAKKGSVQRANLDGSDVQYVVKPGDTTTPKQLRLDPVNRMVYWSDRDGGRIQRCGYDGSRLESLVVDQKSPVGMLLDLDSSSMMWTDRLAGTITRAGMHLPSGQNEKTRKDLNVVLTNLVYPVDLDQDTRNGTIYWADRTEGLILRMRRDHASPQAALAPATVETVVNGLTTPIGVSLDSDARKIYFTELVPGTISRVNLDGSGKETLVWGQLTVTGMVVVRIPNK